MSSDIGNWISDKADSFVVGAGGLVDIAAEKLGYETGLAAQVDAKLNDHSVESNLHAEYTLDPTTGKNGLDVATDQTVEQVKHAATMGIGTIAIVALVVGGLYLYLITRR
jgi:hypothetical protein